MGWIYNFLPTSYFSDTGEESSALEIFFLESDGNTFKGMFLYRPYFYVYTLEKFSSEVISYLDRKYENRVYITIESKVDLEQPNHLSGK